MSLEQEVATNAIKRAGKQRRKALDALAEADRELRECVVAGHHFGLSKLGMAKAAGVTRGTVDAILARAGAYE